MKKILSAVFGLFLCLLTQQTFGDNLFSEMYRASSIGIYGTHHARGIGSSSSSSSCSLSITITPPSPSICSGSSVTLTAVPTDNSSSTFSYTWTSPTFSTYDTTNVDPLTTTSYTVTVTDGIGCSSQAISTVIVNSTPTVTVSPQAICSGNSATLSASVSPPSSSYTYSWSTGGTNSSINITPTTTETYTVTVSDGGCSGTASGTVTVTSSPTVTVSPQTICSGSMATLTANVSPPSSSYTYSWTSGGTSDTIDVKPTTSETYTVTVSDGGSCTATATGVVTVTISPTVTVSPQTICSGSMATLTASVSPPSSSYTYSWTSGGTNDTIDVSPLTGKTYTVTVSDGGSCSATASGVVTVNALPVVTFNTISFPDTICQTSTPYPISGGSPSGGTYSGPNVSGGAFIPSTAGDFRILYTFTDSLGCTDTAGHSVVVNTCTGINNISASSEFDIYPNPVTNSLYVKFNSTGEGKQVMIRITDVTGRTLSESVKTIGGDLIVTMNESGLPAGMYFIRITTGETSHIAKFVKQ